MDSKKARAKKLREVLPIGYLTTKGALAAAGFTVHQIDNYLKAGELEPLAPGVYRSPNTTLSWEGVLASLERLGIQVSVGALTSLEHSGHGHYVAMNQQQSLYLYAPTRLPLWLNQLLPNTTVVTRTHVKLLDAKTDDRSFFEYNSSYENPSIRYRQSKPELAILELLQGVPKHASFEHADLLMEGLTTLSPKRLNEVLSCCNNIRVKRLFFWLAYRHNHSWLNSLDFNDYDLGTGKRVIASPGMLDKEFNITVPKQMHATR